MDQTLSVTALNLYIRDLLDNQRTLSNVGVRGELSNYKIYPSGHHYFTLKDSESSLKCVMFKSSASRLRFRPENGMGVTVWGRVSVYPRDGAYQLYAAQIVPEGTGDLQIAFEQLKAKLEEEGLFDPAHKKPLPRFPERIAIITSAAGAAVHDMIRILGKRWPMTKIFLLPVRVQGVEAPAEIAGAIRYANEFDVADLIITGRGGGSIEDLWAFNDERVARAIYASRLPIISAVGHEPDVTISDYVSDRRASTPSSAAEIAVPDCREIAEVLAGFELRASQPVGGLVLHERPHFLGVGRGGVVELVEDRRYGVVPLQLVQIGVRLHFESCEAVGYLTGGVRHLSSGTTAGERIEQRTDDTYGYLGGLGFLFGGDVGDVVDEYERVVEQFFSGIAEHRQAACGLQRQGYVHIIGVVLTACLNELGVKGCILNTRTFEAEPLGDHFLRYLVLVEQVLGEFGVRLQFCRGQLVTVGRFVVTRVAALQAPDCAVVNDTHALNGVVVVLVRNRQRVKGFEDLIAELIFRVINQHHRQRVAAIRQCFLRLCRQCGTSEKKHNVKFEI